MERELVAVLLTSAAALSYLSIVLAVLDANKKQKESKLTKSGNPRKGRIPNRERNRSINNREKLEQMPEQHFSAGCRMPRSLFKQLLEKIGPVMVSQNPRKRKLPKNCEDYDRIIDPYIALAFTLRWLAGGQRWDLMYSFDVSKSTLHKWTWRVIKAINVVLRDNIMFPSDEPSLDALAAGFANIGGGLGAAIPNTVCAFDGVVIQKCPPPPKDLQPNQAVSSNTAAHYYRYRCTCLLTQRCHTIAHAHAQKGLFWCRHDGICRRKVPLPVDIYGVRCVVSRLHNV